MAKLSTFTCDECEAIKKDTNGWWLVSPGTNGVELWPWSNLQNAGESWHHLCGVECVQRFLGRWMAQRGEEQ